MNDGFAKHRGRRRRDVPLRPMAVFAGGAVFLALLIGPPMTRGIPRQEICSDSGCEARVYWLGLLPHPLVLAIAAVCGLVVTALVLALGLLWRSAGDATPAGDLRE